MRRKLALAGVGVAVVAAFVFWPSKGHEREQAVVARDGGGGAAKAAGRQRREGEKPKRMVSPVAPTAAGAGGARVRTFFMTICADTSPMDRCEQGQPLADQCEAGDVVACVKVADLFFQVPVQPMFAVVYLGRACKLGDLAACERQRRQQVMLKWPEGRLEGDLSPAEACETGDPVGCFHATVLPSTRDEAVDPKLAWKACVAGIADSCSTVAQYSDDPLAAVQAIEVGCKSRSPLHCGLLVSMYDDGLVCCEEPLAPLDERENCFPCPGFDRGRAAGFSEQVTRLTGKPYEPRYEDEPPGEDDGSEGE
jgi:hypothetical protein